MPGQQSREDLRKTTVPLSFISHDGSGPAISGGTGSVQFRTMKSE
jgi:hypothetical protein